MELREPAGAKGYLNKSEGVKLSIEDFKVYEVPKFFPTKGGPHYWSLLEKTFKNTISVANEISKLLQVDKRDIGYAGLKDKRGTTTQWISSPRPPPKTGDGWKIYLTLPSQKKLKRGNLLGNWFKVKISENFKYLPKLVPNFFGHQRFSTNNHEIGKLLITGEKKAALKLMRQKRIPITRRFFVLMEDAYCSYLFNKILSRRLDKPSLLGDIVTRKGVTAPIFGKKINLATDSAGEIETGLLEEENLSLKQFPGDGKRRPMFVEPLGVQLNDKVLQFFLPKGSYATVLLREISKEQGISWNVAHPTSSFSF